MPCKEYIFFHVSDNSRLMNKNQIIGSYLSMIHLLWASFRTRVVLGFCNTPLLRHESSNTLWLSASSITMFCTVCLSPFFLPCESVRGVPELLLANQYLLLVNSILSFFFSATPSHSLGNGGHSIYEVAGFSDYSISIGT